MNRDKILNALEKFDYNYVDQSGKIIVKLDYAQQMLKLMASFSVNCAFLFPNFARSAMEKKIP